MKKILLTITIVLVLSVLVSCVTVGGDFYSYLSDYKTQPKTYNSANNVISQSQTISQELSNTSFATTQQTTQNSVDTTQQISTNTSVNSQQTTTQASTENTQQTTQASTSQVNSQTTSENSNVNVGENSSNSTSSTPSVSNSSSNSVSSSQNSSVVQETYYNYSYSVQGALASVVQITIMVNGQEVDRIKEGETYILYVKTLKLNSNPLAYVSVNGQVLLNVDANPTTYYETHDTFVSSAMVCTEDLVILVKVASTSQNY